MTKSHVWEEYGDPVLAIKCVSHVRCNGCGSKAPKPDNFHPVNNPPHPHLLDHAGVPHFFDCEMQLVHNIMKS